MALVYIRGNRTAGVSHTFLCCLHYCIGSFGSIPAHATLEGVLLRPDGQSLGWVWFCRGALSEPGLPLSPGCTRWSALQAWLNPLYYPLADHGKLWREEVALALPCVLPAALFVLLPPAACGTCLSVLVNMIRYVALTSRRVGTDTRAYMHVRACVCTCTNMQHR